jgi:hypothetical protein
MQTFRNNTSNSASPKVKSIVSNISPLSSSVPAPIAIDEIAPMCQCGILAIDRTVRNGQNVGRKYFSCSKSQNDPTNCNFFQWNEQKSIIEISSASNAINIQCECKLPALIKTVRKEGQNNGKEFYACSKQFADSSKCNFFQWVDQVASQNRQTMGVVNTNTPSCLCGLSSITRIVKKAGANFGKSFCACPKSQSDSSRCDFFQWEDAQDININNYQSQMERTFTDINRPKCFCSLVSKELTSTKEGPNKNRKFFSCVKSVGRCNYFEWADAEPLEKNTTGTCYKCGEPGHFANACTTGPSGNGRSARGSGRGRSKRGRGRTRNAAHSPY